MKALALAAPLALVQALIFLGLQRPSIGLPGQTLQQAQQAISSSTLFQGASFVADPYWPSSYTISKSYDGGEAVLYLSEENGIVGSEILQFRYSRTAISFERDNQIDLSFIASVWGEDVAQDFESSRYTDVIEAPNLIGPNHFYLGEQYGYQINTIPEHQGNSAIYSFSLLSHSEWQATQDQARFCTANPNHDNCLGL